MSQRVGCVPVIQLMRKGVSACQMVAYGAT